MVDNNNNYFFLSGFISISLFFIVMVLVLVMKLHDSTIPQFALHKNDFISITLSPSISKPKQKILKKKILKKALQPILDPIESEEFNIDDLFSEVKTKNVMIKKEKPKRIDAKRLQEINKKINTTKENKVEQLEQLQEVKSTSSAMVVNEYLAKIQLTVYESFYPPQNSQGHTVKAVIELNALGKVLDFRILTYSANSDLNNECDNIRDRLMGINFPINPDNESGIYTINLTAQGNK